MHKLRFFGLIAVSAAFFSGNAAQASSFFPTFNQGALQRGSALPALGEAQLLKPGETASYSALDLTTEYTADSNASESLLQDGETARFAFTYRAAMGQDWEWNVQLPLLVLGGGFLDQIIQDWHGFFGLPNGGREQAQSNQYQYRYVRNGVTLLDVTDSGTQLGDIRLGAGWQWRDHTALRAQLKLPTGNGARLGGGNTGLALWLDHALGFEPDSRWSAYLSAGGSAVSRPKVLAEFQTRAAGFAGGGLAYRVIDALSLTTQLYAQSALFKDTELDALKNPGLQFVLGLAWRLAPDVQFNLAFQEDPIVSSSPDFSLHFGLSLR